MILNQSSDSNQSSLLQFKGSYYELAKTPKTYYEHKEFAEQQTLYGEKGNLVNINDEAEQDFLYKTFTIR